MKAGDIAGRIPGVLAGAASIALLVMLVWTIADIVTRYALARPLRGSIDLVESTLVLVVFLALPECFRREEQVTVDVLDHVVGDKAVGYLKLFAACASMLFSGLLGYTGVQPFLDALRFGDRKPELPIAIFTLLGAIELALAVSIVILIGKFVAQFRRVLAREPA